MTNIVTVEIELDYWINSKRLIMLSRLKLNDDEELEKLVDKLGASYTELSCVECDIDFIYTRNIVSSYYEIEIKHIYYIELINQDNCTLTLTEQDKVVIFDWVCNYKNINDILFKLWSENEGIKRRN